MNTNKKYLGRFDNEITLEPAALLMFGHYYLRRCGMKRRKLLIDFKTSGLKYLLAIAFTLSISNNTQAAIDVLSYWNFDNALGADGPDSTHLSYPGQLYTTAVHGDELYNPDTKTLAPATAGVFSSQATINLSNLDGDMGYNGGLNRDGWGSFAGSTINVYGTANSWNKALAVVGVYNYSTLGAVNNNGKYIEFDLATTGYKNISLSYATRSTSAAFNANDWQYSVDGGTSWTDYQTLSIPTTSSFTTAAIDFASANTQLSNKADVRFRLYLSGALTSTSIQNSRFDNIKFSGLTLDAASLIWNPSVSPGNTWNTTSTNWLNGSTSSTFSSGDLVEFTDAGLVNGSTINVTAALNPSEIHVINTTGLYTFAGASLNGNANLVKTGSGAVAFNVDNTDYSGNITISEGTMQINSNVNPTSGLLQLNGGTLQKTSAGDLTFSKDLVFSKASKIDTNGGNMELSGYLTDTSYSTVGLIKIGTGTLTLSMPDANPPGYYHADVDIQSGTLRLNAANAAGYTAIGDGSVKVQQGGTFQVDNITYGIPSGGYLNLYKGSAFLGTGAATVKYNGISVMANASADPSNVVDLKTNATTDVITLLNSVKQYSTDYTKSTNATIRVSGPGRVVLQSGGVYSKETYGGDWELNSGILQIGPVEPNSMPLPPPGYAGPYGEPLNALGFKVPATPKNTFTGGPRADADLPNAIKVTGGIFAIGVDAPNTNPNIITNPENPTPNYLRNPVTLAGGSIAATGFEVDYSVNNGDPQGVPNSIPVKARLGGDFSVASGTSKVLTYDPLNSLEARTVELVGGSRSITNASAAFNTGDVITYSTNWVGTLQVDAGGTSGGSFNINRSGGNVSVTPGAVLEILAGAKVNLSGSNALSDGTNSVDIMNSSVFDVLDGHHQVGNITGNGSVAVENDTALTAQSIKTGTLTIGAGATVTITPISGGPLAGQTGLTAVPEPSTLVMLSLAALVGLFSMYRNKR